MKEVLIIGAGPAGLACGCRLVELGMKPIIFEASERIGGLAGSIELWGNTVDLGPHRFFSSDPVVNQFWHKHVAGKHLFVSRQTRIFYKGKFFHYPLKPFNALLGLGILRSVVALLSLMNAKVFKSTQEKTLDKWITNRFGKVLFNTFFKTYTEKVWGIPCSELDADWAAQRIKGLTLIGAIKNAFFSKNNSLKTLVDEFAYPVEGNQYFYDKQREYIEANGGVIKLGSPIEKLIVEDSRITGLVTSTGEEYLSNNVISSMPLTKLVSGIPNIPEAVSKAISKLRYRNTILSYILLEGDNPFPDQWLYIHEPTLIHGRVTNFANWSPNLMKIENQIVLCLEFWCFDDDQIWTESEENLISLSYLELQKTGLLPTQKMIAGKVIRLRRSYPVYDHGYSEPLQVISDYVDTFQGLLAIGRYGAFKYNNQDHSILMGLLAAEKVAGHAPKVDLWSINTDSTYQEAGSAPSSHT
jgi:protoporphyrinogen oxidase